MKRAASGSYSNLAEIAPLVLCDSQHMGRNRALRAIVALATVSALGACVGPTIKTKHPGQLELKFHNEAGGPVCKVFVYPFGQQEPSNNILEVDTEITTGGSVATWVEPGTYQINAQG